MKAKNIQQIKKCSIRNYCRFCENHTKHVIHYVGESQELVVLKKLYLYLPLESTGLRLCINSYIYGNGGKFGD
jgi:hypothetical protein